MAAQTSLIPIGITSTNNQGFSVSASIYDADAYKIFDGKYDAGFNTSYRSSTSPSLPENIAVSFPKSYMINGYTVRVGYADKTYSNMATWDFYGLIGGTYILLHSGTNPSEMANTITGTFSPVVVNGIKIVCKSRYGSNSWGIDELEVYEFKYQYQYLIQDKNNNLFNAQRIYPNNLVPTMTSANTPSGNCIASSYYDDNGSNRNLPYKAFNKVYSDCWTTSSGSTGYIGYTFSIPTLINSYTIYPHVLARSPKNWTFEGSNDGTNWIILDIQNNITGWTSNVGNTYNFSNNNYYLYYRLNATANNGDSYLGLSELEMYNTNIELDKLQETILDTLFLNKGITDPTILNNQTPTLKGIYGKDNGILGGGKLFEIAFDNSVKKINSQPIGNYTDNIMPIMSSSTKNGITVWADSEQRNYWAYQAFDNNASNGYAWIATNTNASLYVDFGDGNKKNISKYKIYKGNTTDTISIYGSNNNIDWNLINNSTMAFSSSYEWKEISFRNTTKYRYYKFQDDSGITNSKVNSQINELQLMELTIPFKYLIQYHSKLYTFDGVNMILSPSQTLNDNNFITNGFAVATAITKEIWDAVFPDKTDLKLLMWTNDISQTEAKIICDCDQFDLTQWLKDNKCKLLMWTNDMSKNNVNMVYNINPYTPLDLLSDEFDILEYIK